MKRNGYIVITIIAIFVLHGCSQDAQRSNKGNRNVTPRIKVVDTVATGPDTVSVPKNLADARQPDMRIWVRKGRTLHLETAGFQLTAVDTAVMHTGVYSVTSLMNEEIDPLPQGMMNMTASAAGYQLLPNGEHFSPYAELRVAYDPEKLPYGYTPEDIYTSYFDTIAMAWVRLERLYVDTVRQEIVSVTTHFTDFINELLQAPEMPETQGFVPTQISELEAANPLAGYATIAPPEANNMGTANLSYPFLVPTGRGGIQPQLALTYNSNGGNGVCGVGWDLTMPCISVDTRWGVPLYSDSSETETYLFNGEQLLVSHDSMPTFAHVPVERETDNYTKRFYPRVEGSFDSILRHGTTPQTYWWEVYDRSGNRYIYGLGNGELRSQRKKAIAKWYLTRVIDRNGNTMRYHYMTYKNNDAGSVSGTAIYLDNISYTSSNDGFPNQPWYGYSVTLHYGGGRVDPVITGNYGVKENICLRLDSVKTWFVKNEAIEKVIPSLHKIPTLYGYSNEWNHIGQEVSMEYDTNEIANILSWLDERDVTVHLDSSLVRGYRLLYHDDAKTKKSLLTAVVEMSTEEWEVAATHVSLNDLTDASLFKYHRFGYKEAGSTVFDGNETVLETETGNARSGMEEIRASALGGSRSYREGVSFGAGVGLGGRSNQRTYNIEANGSIALTGHSNGTTTIIDINGDGYPDLLYSEGGEWRCQLFSPEENAYRSADDILVVLPTDGFSRSVTKSDFSVGVSGHLGWEYEEDQLGVNAGAQYTHSVSDNTMYFSDVNADGKPDIVNNGLVWFNNTVDDTVTFGREYVPYTTSGTSCEASYYSLENAVGLDSSIYEAGHHSQTYVSWVGKNLNDEDCTMTSVLKTQDSDTLRRSVARVWIAPYDGYIHITGTAQLDTLFNIARERTDADGVHISIQHNGNLISETYHDLTASSPTHIMEVNEYEVKSGDRIYFRVEALRNDMYDVVEWQPRIVYSGVDTMVLDDAGRKRYVFSAKDDFLAWQEELFSMPMEGTINISADYKYTGTLQNDVTLRIVQYDTLGVYVGEIDSRILDADTSDWLNETTWRHNAYSLDTLHSIGFIVESAGEFDRTKLVWSPHITSAAFNDGSDAVFQMLDRNGNLDTIYAIDRFVSPIFPEELPAIVPDTIDIGIFGHTNHNWGCFVYNSDTMRTPILERKIKEDSRYHPQKVRDLEDLISGRYDTAMGAVPADSLLASMDTLLPNPDQAEVASLDAVAESDSVRVFVAFAGRAYVTPTKMSLYNWYSVRAVAEDSTLLEPVTNRSIAVSGQKAVGPVKGNSQHGFSVHASAGVSIGGEADSLMQNFDLNACFNYSHGSNRLTADFVDFNGDGYPDAISENEAQYSNSWGGLSPRKAGITPTGEPGIQSTLYNAYSLQGGGAYANYRKCGKSRGSVHIQMRSSGGGVGTDNSIAISNDRMEMAWMDLNGDGLPDCVNDGMVAINLGYDYYRAETLPGNSMPQNSSVNNNKSSNVNFSGVADIVENEVDNSVRMTVNNSFSTGKGVSESVNTGEVIYADMNGDGLVDRIEGGNRVFYNIGWGFSSSYHVLNHYVSSKDIGHNIDYSGNLTLGFSIPTIIGTIKIQGSAGLNINNSASTTETMLIDMNADGLPDIVRRDNDNIKVRYNQMYDVDKLITVESFYGNKITVNYAQAPYSAKSRQRPTVMSSLIVSDMMHTSADERHFSYNYSGYVHSVTERTPYGFDSVVITQYVDDAPYRITRQHYRTDMYKMRGRKQCELVTDADGNPYVENIWRYKLKQITDGQIVAIDSVGCYGATWPALDSVVTRHYNPLSHAVMIETLERYIHADSGRIDEYINFNNNAIPSDDLHCKVHYCRGNRNQSALPRRIMVKDASNNTLRHRSVQYNDKGLVLRSTMHNGNDSSSVTKYSYDSYGNPISVELPPNESSQRAKYLYVYDTLMHMFRTLTIDSAFGDTSRTEYDIRLGVPLRVYSIGGDSISYTYDDWGRPLTIRAPQESDTTSCPTIQYRYWDGGGIARQFNRQGFRTFTLFPAIIGKIPDPPCHSYGGGPVWAQTLHRSQKDNILDVSTILFADGHGRVLQTRKTTVVDGHEMQVASGYVKYDDAGRPRKSLEPVEIYDMDFCEYYGPKDTGIYTLTEYDIMDRATRTKIDLLNDSIVYSMVYGFSTVEGVACFMATQTDPELRENATLTDARGLTLQSIDAMQGITRFEYDALGQLTKSYDPEGFNTSYEYDNLGHVISRKHPDAGNTSYNFDAAGNLIREDTPLGSIIYSYSYQRLTDKEYSLLSNNNVHYTYGDSGRARGRIIKVDDGSGTLTLEYDEMGRVAGSVRVMSVPASDYSYTFRHTFEYDSWNRIWQMTYPDGEAVSYRYNKAGDLTSMSGEKANDSRWYINNIKYNKYGQRTWIVYGNGTHAEYSYDPLQRLSHLYSEDTNGRAMQNIEYTFDKVGNITLLRNTASNIGGLGGLYDNLYTYDSLNRLVEAHGNGWIGDRVCMFNIETMNYSASGRLGSKKQDWSSVTANGRQKMEYGYDIKNDKPHAPRFIKEDKDGLYDLRWDQAGNLIRVAKQQSPGKIQSTRFLYWTEDNRLHTVADNHLYSYYTYDHNGERTMKMVGTVTSLDRNAALQLNYTTLQNVTLYPSPYMVLSKQGYTKHYYIGSERLCARIGGGWLNHDTACISQDTAVVYRASSLFHQCDSIVGSFQLTDNVMHKVVNILGDIMPEVNDFTIAAVPCQFSTLVTLSPQYFHAVIANLSGESPGCELEPDVYFYHSDHLGGASWITDKRGEAVQHLQYLPFGQPFVDQHLTGYQERYTFTGKERDEETGFGYFGARYMDYEVLTGWLSVDPMMDKYPSVSPYAYCAWNPVKLVDPDGNEALDNDDWYKNNKGEVRWFNSTDKTYTHEGKEYQRVGKTAYMTNSSGEFVYGDQYGHTHESAPLKEVSIVENLTDFERTMRNPLVQSIHRSAADFWGGFVDLGLDVGAKTFTYCGIGVQSIGFYCMLVPGGQSVGAELFAVGRVFSSIGSTLDAINDVKHDDWGGLVTNVLSWSISRLSMKQIDNGISSGFFSLTTNEKNLLNCYISTRTSYITEAINKGRVQQ